MKQEKLNNIQVIPSKIEELKKIFPEYFDKNGNFLIEKFTQDIQSQTDISKETYSLEWLGKSYARVLATEPVRTLLKENKEWNEKNKNSENLLIKGDNLEVLKHLVNAYENEIKMIYIDPPYNTGKDGFVYQDDRKFTPEELSKLAGINIEKAKRILNFLSKKSNSHSAWLTFMYPRLYIARRLLKNDGVIFVSIDDNEVAQLKILMDEIFGEENFIGTLIWNCATAGGIKPSFFSKTHEYILVYSKDINKIESPTSPLSNEALKQYKLKDDKGWYREKDFVFKNNSNNPNQKYNIVCPDGEIVKPKEGYIYRFVEETFKNYKEQGLVIFKQSTKSPLQTIDNKPAKWNIYIKKYLSNNNAVPTLIPKEFTKIYNSGTQRVQNFFNGYRIFENAKPIELISYLINLFETRNETILDFFAGSGTTGDAVMQLNAEDGGNRKFILVQLPEPINPKKNKVAYEFVKNELKKENPTIYDITKERLIRTAKKIINDKKRKITNIKEEIEKISLKEKLSKKDEEKLKKLRQELSKKQNELEKIKNLDLGFKEFETIPIPEENLKDIEELSEDLDENLFKPITDANALLTTWKVFDGIKLHKQLIEMDFNGYKGYYLENNLYLINPGFTLDNLVSILERIDIEKDFIPSKIIINGYIFDSKTQREIYESINNYNKKDLDKIELIIRY